MMRSVLLLALAGCAPAFQMAAPSLRPSSSDQAALNKAADAYYSATDAASMRAAVESAKRAGPDSAIYHELAASMARFDSDYSAEFEHLYAALLDPQSDAPELHLLKIDDLSLTFDERRRYEALLTTLSKDHPSPGVRAFATSGLANLMRERGRAEVSAKLRGSVPRLSFAVIGVWDNDQGKGFDIEHEPEHEITRDARYDGTIAEIRWRTDPPVSSSGADYQLGSLFSPKNWALGYAVSTFRVANAGPHQLRITSSVPIKVWVNGALIYAERRIEASRFDQFIIPVTLSAGANRVLVKSAQNEGAWVLMARLTDMKGGAIAAEPLPLETEIGKSDSPPITSEQMIAMRSAGEGTRRDLHQLEWARFLGLNNQAVSLGDGYVQRYPGSIIGLYHFAAVSWDHGERNRTSDLLELLAEKNPDLPFLVLQHSRFLLQEGLTRKAREALEQVQAKHPNNPDLWVRFARQFDAEGWLEDHCDALAHATQARPGWEMIMLERAACLRSLGFEDQAVAIYQEIREELPLHTTATSELQEIALGNEQLAKAEELAQAMVQAGPASTWNWYRLAEVRRRRGDRSGAEEALRRAAAIDPDNAKPHADLASIQYQHGDRASAIQSWKNALALNPEDEKLANRLSYLSPEKKEPWELEVPDEEAIADAIAARAKIQPTKGADVLDLLDHEVTRINSDGSTSNFVTHVSHALNQSGRDQLTQMGLPGGGRLRVLHAYAIDPDGTRTQVSNIRGRVARFRGLKIGTTIVLQYRHDARPIGYLSKHVARQWWFQTHAHQVRVSQWIVWADQGTLFHEWRQGDVERTEETKGSLMRLSWTARDVPPLLPEPGMPTMSETAMSMLLSTVPSWDVYLEWEKALLSEAFRESAEVKELAAKLVEGASTPQDKIERIHRYVMEEIRYQQDYEDHIAGVKPHPSSVVVQRAYGDCKDKAVLFITLAKLAGLEAHFTILRTRPSGPLRKEVPMQQFDHAIVYVPQQTGIGEGKFYDPTADSLDLHSLRGDDPGVPALVLDPQTLEHTWREIPFQAPEHNRYSVSAKLALEADGSARGSFEVEAVGSAGATVRKLARNADHLRQGFQVYAARAFPGATASETEVIEAQDLSKPAKVAVKIAAPSLARREEEKLRIELPKVWSPESAFQLAERRFPLLLGTPYLLEWASEIELPKGAKVVRMPKSGAIDAECFRLERQSTVERGKIKVMQRFFTRCERIPVDKYLVHREKGEEINRFLREEVVLDAPRGSASKSAEL